MMNGEGLATCASRQWRMIAAVKSKVQSCRLNKCRIAKQHIARQAIHNVECWHELQQSRECRLTFVEFFIAVLAVEKSRAGKRFCAFGREVALSALHVSPNKIDPSGRML